MGNVTADLQIWTPDEADSGEPDIYLATMSASIEDGVGVRLRKQEAFIGVNLGLSSAFVADGTIRQVPFGILNSWNFNEGMTVSGGSVTIPMDGIYQVCLNANFQSQTTSPGRINSYLYINGLSLAYSSTYGLPATNRYANANIANSYKFVTGDVLNIRVSSLDQNSVLSSGSGSGFSIVLAKPL